MSREKNAGEYLAERFTQPQAGDLAGRLAGIKHALEQECPTRASLFDYAETMDEAIRLASSTTPGSSPPREPTDAMLMAATAAWDGRGKWTAMWDAWHTGAQMEAVLTTTGSTDGWGPSYQQPWQAAATRAPGVDEAMVERACVAYHPERWKQAAESSKRLMRSWMRDAIEAALAQPAQQGER